MPPHLQPSADSHPRRPRVAVLGATLGTGNLGVDALGMAMVQGLVTAVPEVEVIYQSWDLRLPVRIPVADRVIECEPMAIRRKGSLRRRDGLEQIQRMARLRQWLAKRSMPQLPTLSRALKQLLSCDLVLDVSAGDSFANIYGDEIFWYQSQIKLLCLELGLPLVLMPQTYGPFNDPESAEQAAEIISRATLVCSREADGIAEIKQLCESAPPHRAVRVPDMAFLLEPQEAKLPPSFLQARDQGSTCIAINVSGLLYFERRSFGLQAKHAELVHALVDWALSVPDAQVLLVPHVVSPTLYPGSKSPRNVTQDTTDTTACEKVRAHFTDTDLGDRIHILPEPSNPAEAKYAMSFCDYFVGARMHAFIGASSQTVPGTLLAYSKKAAGLASLLDIGDAVVDLRDASIEQCIAAVDANFQSRGAFKTRLEHRVPDAQAEIQRFFTDEIAPFLSGSAPNDDLNQPETTTQDPQQKLKRVLS